MNRTRRELCALCQGVLERKGDDWGDLCPGCADLVSEFLDRLDLTDADADALVEFAERITDRMP